MIKRRRYLFLLFSFVLSLVLFISAGVAGADPAIITRDFNKTFDRLLDDFTEDSEAVGAYLSVDWDNNCKTPNDAIYKAASAAIADATSAQIPTMYIKMRGSADLGDIKLVFRHKNDTDLCTLEFSDLVDTQEEPLPALTSSWQMYEINIVADYGATYDNSTIPFTPESIVGFHIVAKENTSGHIEIDSIHFGTSSDYDSSAYKVDTFEGNQNVNIKREDIYWCGSETGVIIPRHVTIDSEKVIKSTDGAKNNKDGKYEYVAIGVKGTGTVTVATVDGETVGTAQALEGIEGTYKNIVLPLPNPKAAEGIKITVTGGSIDVCIVFFTNLESETPAYEYPRIDTSDCLKFDDFYHAQTGINEDYDQMSKAEAALKSNLYYRISYKNGNLVTIADGVLTLDATTLADGDHINYKSESKVVDPSKPYKYIVFKMKGEDGASLAKFRFGMQGDVVWGNGGLLSATALPIPDLDAADYPYTEGDWKYIIVDIEKSGLTFAPVLDMYYGGPGKLIIDEIFFANEYTPVIDIENGIAMVSEQVTFDTQGTGGYKYLGYLGHGEVNNIQAKLPFMVIRMKGTGAATLQNVRLEFVGDKVLWFAENEAGSLLDPDGNLLPELTDEFQDYIIDLNKSGLNPAISGIHVHDSGTAEAGSIIIDYVRFAGFEKAQEIAMVSEQVTFDQQGEGGYKYLGYLGHDEVNNTKAQLPYMVIRMKGTGAATLDSVRLEFVGDKVLWFAENDAGSLLGPDGNRLPELTSEFRDYVIDLHKSGLNPAISGIHVHANPISEAGTIIIEYVKFFGYAPGYDTIMASIPEFDSEAPQISIDLPATARAGDVITVNPTVVDNVSAPENITVEIEVVFNGEPVTLVDGKFTASVGTYTITITAVDEALNEAVVTKQITVSAISPDPSSSPEPGTGCGCSGANINSAIALAFAAVMISTMILIRRKEKAS